MSTPAPARLVEHSGLSVAQVERSLKYLTDRTSRFAVLTLPLTSILALGQFTNINFFATILAAILGLISGWSSRSDIFRRAGFMALSLLLFSLISMLANGSWFQMQTSEVISIYRIHVFLVIYAACISVIFTVLDLAVILRLTATSVLASALYGIIDSSLQQWSSINFDDYFYRFSVQENHGTLAGYYRVRSTFSEPGHYSFFLNVMSPWAIYYFDTYKKSPTAKYAAITLLLAAQILTFSAAGYFVFVLMTSIIGVRSRRIVWFAPALMAGIFVQYTILTDFEFGNVFLSKFMGTDVGSAMDRAEKIDYGLDIIRNAMKNQDFKRLLLGHGPSYITSNFGAGLINSYLFVAIEFGCLAVLSICIFFVKLFTQSAYKGDLPSIYTIGAIAAHIVFIQDYFYLFVPFSLAMMVAASSNNKVGRSIK